MKAVVTIIDDDGFVLYKDQIIHPIVQKVEREPHLKRARFHFEVVRALHNMVCEVGKADKEGADE